MQDGDVVDTSDKWNQAAAFWVGLFGIVATGAMVGIGGDNYWGLAHFGGINPPSVPQWSTALLGAFAFYVALSDLVALGVIFAGAAIFVLRLPNASCAD
jgi:hypothetical protein